MFISFEIEYFISIKYKLQKIIPNTHIHIQSHHSQYTIIDTIYPSKTDNPSVIIKIWPLSFMNGDLILEIEEIIIEGTTVQVYTAVDTNVEDNFIIVKIYTKNKIVNKTLQETVKILLSGWLQNHSLQYSFMQQ